MQIRGAYEGDDYTDDSQTKRRRRQQRGIEVVRGRTAEAPSDVAVIRPAERAGTDIDDVAHRIFWPNENVRVRESNSPGTSLGSAC